MSMRYSVSTLQGDAIDRCLAGCYRDDSPMLRLSECLDELRTDGWAEEDVRQVELLVLKRLVGLQADQLRATQQAADDTVID
jgi:hypothetical protein